MYMLKNSSIPHLSHSTCLCMVKYIAMFKKMSVDGTVELLLGRRFVQHTTVCGLDNQHCKLLHIKVAFLLPWKRQGSRSTNSSFKCYFIHIFNWIFKKTSTTTASSRPTFQKLHVCAIHHTLKLTINFFQYIKIKKYQQWLVTQLNKMAKLV